MNEAIKVILSPKNGYEGENVLLNGVNFPFGVPFETDQNTISLLRQLKNYKRINYGHYSPAQILQALRERNPSEQFDLGTAEIILEKFREGKTDARLPSSDNVPVISVEVA